MNRPFRVLIADDEKPVAAGLQGQLESLGYDVMAVVNDGHHAIEVCRRSLPDVVLMDIEMPGLDGLSAARQIVRDPGTPVVILTAHGHPNLIDQAVEDGVVYYLLKPVTSPRTIDGNALTESRPLPLRVKVFVGGIGLVVGPVGLLWLKRAHDRVLLDASVRAIRFASAGHHPRVA